MRYPASASLLFAALIGAPFAAFADAGAPTPKPTDTKGQTSSRTLLLKPVYRWAPISISLLPFLSTRPLYGGPLESTLSFNLLMGQTERLSGIELGFGVNRVTDRAAGLQFALGANVADNQMFGAQIALVTNLNLKQGSGLQASFGYNMARAFNGVQFGAVNVSQTHRGMQVGLLNVSGKLDGVQLGLINVAEDADLSLGLLNFVDKGLLHLDAWGSDTGIMQLGIRFGSRHTYTLLTAGSDLLRDRQRWTAGVGLGLHFPFWSRFFVNVDILGQVLQRGLRFQKQSTSLLGQARLIAGLRIFKYFGVFAGVTANMTLADEDNRNVGNLIPDYAYRKSEMAVWPGFVLGIQI